MSSFYIYLFLFIVSLPIYAEKENFVESTVEIQVVYSPSADVFEIMDNVSGWWEGFTEDEYKKYWLKNYGINENDKKLFETYKELRFKYYNDPDQKPKDPMKNRNGFFSTIGSVSADPIAEAFYTSNSLEQSFQKLKSTLTKKELLFLINFYKNFESKYANMIVQSEEGFQVAINKVSDSINKSGIKEYFSKVSRFYNIQGHLNYRVLYVWFPPINRTLASPSGSNLIMRYNPALHGKNDDSDIIAHEIIHTISKQQSLSQKKYLTSQFIAKCPDSSSISRLKILEEPLAVAFGQLIFNKKFFPEKFNTTSNLYNSNWITTMARLIYIPLLERFENDESITDGFIDDAAVLCRDLTGSYSELLIQ